MKPVVLSRRMQAVADMVSEGNSVCDIGCDHGFVSIYLVEQGISPRVLAMDVREGPLGAAVGHVAERGLGGSIETRLSDGLHNYKIGEADTLLCAGMGGRLMMRILSEERGKTASFRELVLQPQSQIEAFRRFLYEEGYRIAQENMIEEDGKFYPMMRAVAAEGRSAVPDRLSCRYGPRLLEDKSQVLLLYLKREERIYDGILKRLRTPEGLRTHGQARYAEVERLLEDCRCAIGMIGKTTEGG